MIEAAERFQAIQNVAKNGSFGNKSSQRMIEAAERFQAIENVSKNGSFGHKILPTNEAQVSCLKKNKAACYACPGTLSIERPALY